MVAKRYGNNRNNTNTNNGGNFVVGKSGGSAGSGGSGGYGNNAGGYDNNVRYSSDKPISFMINGKNALIFAKQFKTKRNNTPMIRFTIYDFDAMKKYSSAIPLAVLLKTAFPTLQLNLEEIGDLTPQPPAQ